MSSRASEHTPLPLPNGWFAVAWSRELVEGDVVPIHYFGEDLVLFRSRDGRARVLDAYCPHLGAHLGEGGRVVGDAIRCPFHGWQYDGASGQCVSIPYCDKIPPLARVRSWPVTEANDMIFVWRHAEGKPPEWEVPALPELGDEAWARPRHFEIEIPVHMQDLHENNLDPVHFQMVHGMQETPPSKIEYGEGGRYTRVSHTSTRELPFGTFEMTLVRESWGLGLSSVRSLGIPNAGLLMFSSTGPIDSGRSHMRWILTVTKNLADIAGEEFIDGLTSGLMQDLRIWKNKVHRAQPVLCEADTELSEFRRWVKQFYSDPA